MPKLLSPKVPVLQPILTTTLASIQTKTSRKHVKTPVKSNPTISSSTASLALVALSHMPVAPSPVASETKLNTFRISSKKFFLTFPHVQTSLSFQEIFDLILRNSTQTLTSVIIAKEPHSDGSPHFHIFLEFQKKFDTKNPKVFDYIFNKHGNYSSVKNFKQTIKYITKHNDYQEFLSDFTTTKNSLTTQMRLILELPKAKPHDLYQLQEETVRNTIFEVSNKIETYHRRFHAYLHEKDISEKHHILLWDLALLQQQASPELLPYVLNLLPLLHFLNRYMNKAERVYKSPQILIWSSEPNYGKSSFMNLLDALSPTYNWPTDNWYELYTNYLLQFILWDEFTLIGHTQEFLKLLLAGNPLKLPIKGSQIFKKDNPIIFCASNYSLKEHVKRKYSIVCNCNLPNDRTLNSINKPICLHSYGCTTSVSASLYYDALCARVKEFKLIGPLFPNGTTQPALWEQMRLLLRQAAILNPSPGEPCTARDTYDVVAWEDTLDDFIVKAKV